MRFSRHCYRIISAGRLVCGSDLTPLNAQY
jgi:hypothetical protein